MFQINTDKVDNLEALKGKNIHASWNGKTQPVKMRASKKFSSTTAAMMEVTVQNVKDILRVHGDDKIIEMKLLDTDTISVDDYFDKPLTPGLWLECKMLY